MALTTSVCPSCQTTLRFANAVPPGKRVKCPRCGHVFAVAEAPPAAIQPRPQTTAPLPPLALSAEPSKTVRRPARVEDDDTVRRTSPRRPPKSNVPLIIGVVAGGVLLLLLAAGGLAVVWLLVPRQSAVNEPQISGAPADEALAKAEAAQAKPEIKPAAPAVGEPAAPAP